MSALIELDVSDLDSLGRIDVRLNRADRRNALTRQMLYDLVKVIDQIAAMSEVRVVVLASSGSVFCAGMDLGEMQQHAHAADKEQQWQLDSELYCQLLTKIFQLPCPTVAQLQGPVLAGGVGLALACDLMVGTTDVFFSLPEPVRGITAAIVTPFLIYRVGAGVAGQWLLSGERVTAATARQVGLCYDVVEPSQLTNRTEELVKNILNGAPAALAITKRHWHNCAAAADVVAHAKASIAVSAEARQTDDAREGLAAFLENRRPNWVPDSM